VVRDFPVPLREPIMMHDMALTQRYALLLDVPLVFDPKVGPELQAGGLLATKQHLPAWVCAWRNQLALPIHGQLCGVCQTLP
jgi:carotenoid cleavage dioxygenase-like enzyme